MHKGTFKISSFILALVNEFSLSLQFALTVAIDEKDQHDDEEQCANQRVSPYWDEIWGNLDASDKCVKKV